ncbi:MAG TPA: NAD(P)/FAD-dependent oxidoreductase [Rhizobiales bacterium]|nr:NAD(P)/FAD-dependent oxidoreductase [Hyphomicrobiales bacterium]
MYDRLTIIGSGFAGLAAAEKFRKLDSEAEITIIGKSPHFVYLPSLIWIPSGKRTGDGITIALQSWLERRNIRFHQAPATGLGDGGRIVKTEKGEIENDGLVIACGGRFIKKLPGIENAIVPCEGVAAGEEIRDRLKALEPGSTIAIGFAGNPKEPAAMRGGPMFEFLFGIDRQLRKEGRRDGIKMVFFCPAPRPGNRLGEKAVDMLMERMRRQDIEIHVGHKIKSFENGKVRTEGGEFDASLILFMPGMTGNKWFAGAGLPLSEGGLIKANELCQVEGMERVYVAGDSGSFPGPGWMPKQAHMAELQARAAAQNLFDEMAGRQPVTKFKTELVCIIDSLDKGALVYRSPNRSVMLPNMRALHWSKRIFETWHLRQYR